MIRWMQGVAVIATAALTTILAAGFADAESVSDFYREHALTILVPSGASGLNALYAQIVGCQGAGGVGL